MSFHFTSKDKVQSSVCFISFSISNLSHFTSQAVVCGNRQTHHASLLQSSAAAAAHSMIIHIHLLSSEVNGAANHMQKP